MQNFEEELRSLINRYSRENDSNTPDFLLCNFILNALGAANSLIRERDKWYGLAPYPGKTKPEATLRLGLTEIMDQVDEWHKGAQPTGGIAQRCYDIAVHTLNKANERPKALELTEGLRFKSINRVGEFKVIKIDLGFKRVIVEYNPGPPHDIKEETMEYEQTLQNFQLGEFKTIDTNDTF